MTIVGVVGGGQLARMMHPAAIALGIDLRVFAEASQSPAHYAATKIGDYTNIDQISEFSLNVDALTFDHEHVPRAVLIQLENMGVSVRPGSGALMFAQNKLEMRRKLAGLGMPQPIWAAVTKPQELSEFIVQNGPAVIVKTPIGGYDGRGVRVVTGAMDVADWFENISDFGGELLVEEKVNFVRELSQLSARNPSGDFRTWDCVETIQENSVCSVVISPAQNFTGFSKTAAIARTISEGLGVIGVMAVELFETQSGELKINELAMRPHNSGHFSIEGSVTSQFEQHLRAVLDMPLGDTSQYASVCVMVNLLGVDDQNDLVSNYSAAMKQFPTWKFHSYQKQPRQGRKMGHVTALGDDAKALIQEGLEVRNLLYQSSRKVNK